MNTPVLYSDVWSLVIAAVLLFTPVGWFILSVAAGFGILYAIWKFILKPFWRLL